MNKERLLMSEMNEGNRKGKNRVNLKKDIDNVNKKKKLM